MSYRRTAAIARKELLHIVRDRRSLGLALALPLVLLLLFGYALSLDVDRIPTVIYDQDRTPESRELVQRFEGSRYFSILGVVDNYRAIERGIDRDRVLLAVVIPKDYARNLANGTGTEVQLLLDGSDSNTASIARGYAESVVQTHAAALRAEGQNRKTGISTPPPVEARVRIWYNSELKSRIYIVPGLIAVTLMIIAALLTSLTIAREWETGAMEQLLSTPVRPAELALGKIAAYFLLGATDMFTALTAGVFIFGVPIRGSVVFLIFTSCLFTFGALSWGVLLSALTRNQTMAFQLGMVSSFLPAFLLSGFVYSIENMPGVIQVITHIVPARYFVTILKGVCLKGAGMEILWTEVLFLFLYAGVVFLITTRTLRQKVA
jgi:ABC-2 type transport system permease protein